MVRDNNCAWKLRSERKATDKRKFVYGRITAGNMNSLSIRILWHRESCTIGKSKGNTKGKAEGKAERESNVPLQPRGFLRANLL